MRSSLKKQASETKSTGQHRPWEELLYDPDPETRDQRPPTYSEDGTDLALIRWYLKMTPEQRLQTLQNYVNFVVAARNARNSDTVHRSGQGS